MTKNSEFAEKSTNTQLPGGQQNKGLTIQKTAGRYVRERRGVSMKGSCRIAPRLIEARGRMPRPLAEHRPALLAKTTGRL